jgi:outer membrane receptor protein involved in Fe transport
LVGKEVNVRSLLVLILTVACAVTGFAQDRFSQIKGQSVASVIDNFRLQGWPFAYSTNLVSDDLLVLHEPQASDPLDVVKQILEPHDLVIRSEEGLFLVVRNDAAPVRLGSLLIVVRDRLTSSPLDGVTIQATPAQSDSARLAPGIHQITDIIPDNYRLEIGAIGFQAAVRDITIVEGESAVLLVELDVSRPEIENITVSASRYEISRDISTSRFSLDKNAIETLPDVGEDPIRAAQRLPGAAASGASARAHFRGGEDTETGIILNGQRLFDPFHVRDYQNIFSSVDARAVEGIEVYTGGFPVQYGDRMSSVVLMESLESTRPRYTEIGLSVFNTSLLSSGSMADGKGNWLVSARRGNLDLVIDKNLGEPSYYDAFAEFSVWLTPETRLTANGILADDRVLVITESDVGEREQVTSDTRNAQFWLGLDNRWSDKLSSKTVLSVSSFSNNRVGFTVDPEKVVSDVDDRRKVDQFGFRQDWSWLSSESHMLQWGFSIEQNDAQFAYVGNAEFFGLREIIENAPDSINRDLAATPQGASYGLYMSDRWRVRPGTILEFGLRWDDQTYTGLRSHGQLSPRFSALHALSGRTEIRFSWGRYYQSQGIQELQIEDGVSSYFPAQRADHVILGINRKLGERHALRLEIFQKDMDKLRPRFENLFDPLALIPELQPDRISVAPTSAKSSGLELSMERSGRPLSWWASYTLSKVTDTIDGREEPRSWDQRHSLQAGITWTDEEWDFSLAAQVHSGWPTTTLALQEITDALGNTELVAVPGPRNTAQLNTFATLDARVSRTWDVGRGTLTAFIEIANVLDRKNVCCYDYDIGTDENDDDVLEYSNDYWLPLLPAVGVLWQF